MVNAPALAVMNRVVVGGRPIGGLLARTRAISVELANCRREPARRPASRAAR